MPDDEALAKEWENGDNTGGWTMKSKLNELRLDAGKAAWYAQRLEML